MIKYGVVVMRGQPPHLGHQHIIDKIRQDGLQPLVLVGSANVSSMGKNPFKYEDRANMFLLMDPDILIEPLNDYGCNEEWLKAVVDAIVYATGESVEHSTIYLHDKIEDLYNFTFRGKDYSNEHYSIIYKEAGLNTTHLPISDIKIRAKLIRINIEGNKKYLHPKVYKYLKETLCYNQ